MTSVAGVLTRYGSVWSNKSCQGKPSTMAVVKLAPLSVKPRARLSRSVAKASHRDLDEKDEEMTPWIEKVAAPAAALTICALLSGAVIPEEAVAARSGGRMGGSSFRSRPAPSMPRRGGGGGGGSYRQYNYYGSPGIAPPLIGGYGYGMGGYGIMPSFFFPIGFGGIFNIFIALFVISAITNAVKGFQRRNDDRDDFDDDF